MRIARTDRFRRAYQRLTEQERELARKAIGLLVRDLRHPGLRAKKIQGAERVWEARASRSLRMTFQIEGDIILLRTIGAHDRVLDKP